MNTSSNTSGFTRHGFLALGLACLLVLAGLVVFVCVLPSQKTADQSLEYGYVQSSAKSESVAFTRAAAHGDTYFLFGSSELTTLPNMVSSVPDRVFQEYDCGMQFMYIGDAYDQSLWLAIAAGAYAQDMPNKEVAIIVSPQWFYDGGLEQGIFKMRFSYNLYQHFCENGRISPETKAYVAARLIDEGVDGALIDGGDPEMFQDYLNRAAFLAMSDFKLRQALGQCRARGVPRQAPSTPPNFDALRQQVQAEAQMWCTNNEWGIFDAYWSEHIEPDFEMRKGTLATETLTKTSEYDDLSCFLAVCKESGLEPYVVVAPVNGFWYDHVGLSAGVRHTFYERVETLCADAGVACLNMAAHEYELYYLRDSMHMGWLGWIDIEEGFMEFARKEHAE
ncbi:MAG: D-alanyl-lipoteichoic acid biosynthesis protein DltD [Eggerthellaceae bacterium]|nr:D-alanyl-lipoteichoic acid biosynthesis protein DltD [Eggerthellaceae bacterium]